MKINPQLLTLSVLLPSLLLSAQPSLAAFKVSSGQSHVNAPCPYEPSTCTLPPEEDDCPSPDIPLKEAGHFYGRASVNSGTLILNSIRNRSTGTNARALLTTPRYRQPQVGLELALGYFFDRNTRLEFEYLVNRNLNYNPNPAFSTVNTGVNLATQVINNTFLFNGYYDFIFGGYERFRPFITAGLGPSFNGVRTIINDSSSTLKNKQYVTFAFGGGLGFRFMLWPHWSLIASFRYISLGTVKIEPNTNPANSAVSALSNFRLEGNYTYAPASIGLVYVF